MFLKVAVLVGICAVCVFSASSSVPKVDTAVSDSGPRSVRVAAVTFSPAVQRAAVGVVLVGMALGAALLVYARRRRDEQHRFVTSTRLSIMDKEVQRTARFIESNFSATDMTTQSIAEQLVTGPAFLDVLFEKELGMNVEQFVAQVRINRLRQFLETNPSTPEADVSALCGFINEDAMRAAFFMVTGLILDVYREALVH